MMATEEKSGSTLVLEHLIAVRNAAEPEQEFGAGRFQGGSSSSGEPRLNGSELPLLLALLKIAETKAESTRKIIDRMDDPLTAFWVERPTKTGTLSKKVSSTETFDQVYERLIDWGWIEQRVFGVKRYMRFQIGRVGTS